MVQSSYGGCKLSLWCWNLPEIHTVRHPEHQPPWQTHTIAPRGPVTMRVTHYGTQSIMQSPGDSHSTASRGSWNHHEIHTVWHLEHHAITRRFTQYGTQSTSHHESHTLWHPEHHAITRRFTHFGTQSIIQSPGDSHSTASRASCNHHEIHTVRHLEHHAITRRFTQYGTQSTSHHESHTLWHPEHHAITRRFRQYGTQCIKHHAI